MNISLSSTRDYSIDNIRFFLILSVVFAHLLEVCTPFVGSEIIYKCIYSFHMPAFIFLFGYNVKYSPKKIVYRWCLPYVIFQCIYIIFAKSVLHTHADFQFTTPYWLLWYLLACIFYQLLLPLFDTTDKSRQILALLCAFLLSFLVGYENDVGYYLSLSRFFVFQPWFLLGYYSKKNNLLQRCSTHSLIQVLILFVSVTSIVVLVPIVQTIPRGLLYGSYSYSACRGTIWMRGIASLISFFVILFLFVGLKPYIGKQLILVTSIGQNTWPIFLLHGFVIKAVPVYCPHLVDSPIRVFLLSCGILIIAGNKLCSSVVRCICFSWLEKLHPKDTKWKNIG